MISRIRIQNFGSLVDIDVPLGPLTVLVGPNSSGKTTFIRGLRALTKLVRSSLRGPSGEFDLDRLSLDQLVSFTDRSKPIRFAVWLDDPAGEPGYEVELSRLDEGWTVTEEKLRGSDGAALFDSTKAPLEFATTRRGTFKLETPGRPPRHGTLPYMVYPYREDPYSAQVVQPFLEFQRRLGVSRVFRPGVSEITSPILPPWIKPESPYVDEAGRGFVQKLAQLSQTRVGRELLDGTITPWLQSLFPHLKSLGFKSFERGISLEYESDRYSQPLPAQAESDGVNLALFFVALPFVVGDGSGSAVLVGLEEPEAGTHPLYQRARLELLRRISKKSPGGFPVQIVATTHSPEILRWVRREEALEVLRFVEHRGSADGTKILRLTQESDLDRVLEAYDRNLGLAWYSGALGGVPPLPIDDEDQEDS